MDADEQHVDRRVEPRETSDLSVRLEVLTEPRLTLNARLMESSGRGGRLLCDRPIFPGSALRIEMSDELLLAEAIHSQGHARGFLVGFRVDQRLARVQQLHRLLESLDWFDRSPAATPRT